MNLAPPKKRQGPDFTISNTMAGGHTLAATSLDMDEDIKVLLRRIRDKARRAKHSDGKVYEAIKMIKQAIAKQDHLMKSHYSHPSLENNYILQKHVENLFFIVMTKMQEALHALEITDQFVFDTKTSLLTLYDNF